MHPRQRPPGATDQIEVAATALGQPGVLAQFLLGDGAGPDDVAAGAFRQPDGTDRQRGGAADLAGFQPHQFQAAAAEVAQDAIRRREAEQQPIGGKPALLLPGQDADRHAGHALLQCGGEFGAVAGIPHRGGGHHLQRVRLHGAGDGVVAAHHGQRLADRVLIQPAAALQPTAEAEHRLFIEDRLRVPPPSLEHHEANGVGTEVDHTAA
jgi:hypothetical protein